MARKKILNEFQADDLQSSVPDDGNNNPGQNVRPADNTSNTDDVAAQGYDMRLAFLQGILSVVRGMSPDQLQSAYQDMMPYLNGNADASVGGKDRPATTPNMASLQPGGTTGLPQMPMQRLGESITVDAFKALFEEAGLSEDFTTKALEIVNTALEEKAALIEAKIQDEADVKLAEHIEALDKKMEAVVEELSDGISNYMTIVAENWFNQNELAIESGYKVTIGESILAGLKQLTEDHAIRIEEENVDVVADLQTKASELQENYNNVANELVEARKEIIAFRKDQVITEAAKGLTLVQTQKLRQLAEAREFTDAETFKTEVLNLRENYINQKTTKKSDYGVLNENNDDADDSNKKPLDSRMQLYVVEASRNAQR